MRVRLVVSPAVIVLSAAGLWAQCTAPANPIVAENCQAGAPYYEWNATDGPNGLPVVPGFTTDFSVNRGSTVSFKISSAVPYHGEIYRIGFYNGSGARRIGPVTIVTTPAVQPACLADPSTGLIDCGNWSVSAVWDVPATAVSGVYIAHLVRDDGTGSSNIPFVVRDDTNTSDILFQTSETTWHAYNTFGGNSLYASSTTGLAYMPAGRAYKVSYNRPFQVAHEANTLWRAEYPMIRWLEANGYDVSYIGGVDADRNGVLLRQHKLFLSVGHDEYWSAGQRANVEAARDAGVHLAFFSGNEIFWKTRWEPSIDGTGTPYRSLVCYKETHANAKIDPTPAWTGTWRDPRFSPPADGGRPENSLTGTLFMVNGIRNDSIEVPAEFGRMRLWRNTAVGALSPGTKAVFPAGTLGYEWDVVPNDSSRPPGTIRLSEATLVVDGFYLRDYGSTYGTGTATHSLSLYRAISGALVFGAGTTQWSWGLDSNHTGPAAASDVRMQQATVNLLADMGIQAATLQPALFPAVKSTDTLAPAISITSTVPSSLVANTVFPFSGTASDTGGGSVAGIEVSTDGGVTWLAGTGRESWSYTWTPRASGVATVRIRAIDDSGNIGTPATVTVDVTCPCSALSPFETPATPLQADGNAVELGMRFRVTRPGTITGIRFYKGGVANAGPHTGHLWTATGTLLGTATFTTETDSGWQQANLSTPVAVTAGTTYVVSYFAPYGRYSVTRPYFTKDVGVDPIIATANAAGAPNGVYRYGTSGGFPTTAAASAGNYWVDVVFSDAVVNKPPVAKDDSYTVVSGQVLNVSAAAGVLVNDQDPDGDPMTARTLTGPSGGTLAFSTDGSFTYTPPAGYSGVMSFTYTASDSRLDSNAATVSITVTPNRAPAAANDAYTVVSGLTFSIAAPGILANDSDPEGAPLTAVQVSSPSNGTLTLGRDGAFLYTSTQGFAGTTSFLYKANDGTQDGNTATVSLAVRAATTPIANDDKYTVARGAVLNVAAPGLLANDYDPDRKKLSVNAWTLPAQGVLSMGGNGKFTYTPAAGFTGTVSFTYTVKARGLVSNTAVVTISVGP